MNKPRLAFLDVGRAVAALLVVLQHVFEIASPAFRVWTENWFDLGRCGVLLFFLISGFVIPFTLERGGSLKTFWINRFFRLYPLYWLSLALAILAVLARGWPSAGLAHEPVRTAAINVTMLQDFFRVGDVVGLYWTLAYELAFYALLSLLFALRVNRFSWFYLLLFAGLFASRPHLEYQLTMFSTFFLGTLVYRVWSNEVSRKRSWAVSVIWAAAILIALLRGAGPGYWAFGCALVAALAGFAALYALRDKNWNPALAYLGRISYSIYLMHGVLLLALAPLGNTPCAVGVLALTIPLSMLTYRYLETPAIAFGKRLASRTSKRLAAEAA